MPALTIARAAREAGVNIQTVRFYERRGLIERPPKGEGYRVYSPAQVARVRFIKEVQQFGFSLAEIKELLALQTDPNADCSVVQQQAMTKQQEVRRKIDRLREIDAALETLIAGCPGRGAFAMLLDHGGPDQAGQQASLPMRSRASASPSKALCRRLRDRE
jgi:MerR family copper efflux transcriptional regulator